MSAPPPAPSLSEAIGADLLDYVRPCVETGERCKPASSGNGWRCRACDRELPSTPPVAAVLDALEVLVRAARQGCEDREIVMYEAFMTGRIYATRGEKELPAEIQAKLRENCEKALRRARATGGET